jgi:hypothetical protein
MEGPNIMSKIRKFITEDDVNHYKLPTDEEIKKML